MGARTCSTPTSRCILAHATTDSAVGSHHVTPRTRAHRSGDASASCMNSCPATPAGRPRSTTTRNARRSPDAVEMFPRAGRLFSVGQGREKPRAHDVFDAHDLRVLEIPVEDHALNQLVIQDRAVMVGLHLRFHVTAVEVKAVQISIDGTNRRLRLKQGGPCFQRIGFWP